MREIFIIRDYFLHPRYFFITCAPVEIATFNRFSCFMAQKTCFRDSYVLLGVRVKNLIMSTILAKRNAKYPIPAI